VAVGYSNLEYDLDLEQRGSRSDHAESLLTRLTGSEAALVVNNNAAAVLLMLTALCQGAEVIISRGQLVEIGGGFRIPDVMAQSGARLIEVGTTNRTHLHDYADAIGENTAAILVAHHSNYKIIGFTSEPSLADLAHLARDNDLLLLYDQGSGALLDTSVYGLEREPCVNDGVRDGVDVIAFSGDKLVGGPQAGILCGSQELIQRIKGHPLARAVRADKLCLAALTDTLRHYLVGGAAERIPVWAMIARTVESLEEVASSWADSLQAAGLKANVIDGESTIGGGSLPGTTLPTRLLAIEHSQVHYLASRLHHADPPILGRIARNRLLLDPRTVAPEQVDKIVNSVIVCVQNIVSEKD
jgi:L-seryl-tRNA(Ser) seleniumtransferase